MQISQWFLYPIVCLHLYVFQSSEMGKLSGIEEWQRLSSHEQLSKNVALSKLLDFERMARGRKCGFRFMDLEDDLQLGSFSRIIGGRMSVPGGQPWQVSIKRGHSHFCGGSLIGDDVVVTAAHCVVDFDLKVVKNLIVTVGEFDLGSEDEEEQNVPVSEIIIHPDFNRFGHMDSDIALLYLKHQVQYGYEVQPICLPHKEDVFEAGTLCVVSGWGKTSEAGSLSNILQEVELPIIDSITCNKLLKTLKLPPGQKSMLCAGFPDGGRDACKGDSGGPLACRKASGTWTLVGITSWGIGCGKGWLSDKRVNGSRGSPGIFSKVNELLDFITQHMITGPGPSFPPASSQEECNPHGTLVFGESGLVRYPRLAEDNYLDNSWCIWNLTVSKDKIILVEFIKLDVEDEIECDQEYVAFYSSKKELIGKICGDVLPSPLLIESDQAVVIFASDGSIGGRGFEFTFSAVLPASEAGSGCGSVAMLVEEGKIDTANYPGLYPSGTKCHWLIEAPADRVIKLEFEDFVVEISQDCVYDAVVVYGDAEEEHQLALLCGFSIPSPVWSPGNIMLIHFESDKENNFRGFKAKFTFVSSATYKAEYEDLLSKSAFEPKDIPLDICGFPPFGPQRLSTLKIGGEEACPHCWPWHVSLHFLGDYRCGGAIINLTWVLTAAHCVKITNNPSYWTVVAGNHDIILKEAAEQVRKVESITMHPAFDVASYGSDIALVQLQTPLIYGAAVRPVCLPRPMELLMSFVLCTVTGWANFQGVGGLATRLQQMHVPLVANDVCEQNYYFNHPGGITPQMLCAGFASLEGHESCQGDSGLLVCQSENKPFILHGLASWGVGCAQPKRPGVYSRVSAFSDWIESVMKEKGPAEMSFTNIGLETSVRSLESPMNLLQAVDGQDSSDKQLATEERKCGIPVEDLFSMEAMPTNTSLEGQSKLELFSGNLTSPVSWPWLVSLQFENKHFCIGILIEKTWVLTAGRCNVSTQEDKVAPGITNLLPGADGGTQISVKAVYFHANLSGLPPRDEISLIELEIPIQTGDTIGLTCLPEQEDKIPTDAKCFAVGWNTTGWFSRRLQQTEISLLTNDACTRYWGEDIKNTTICGSAKGTTSCARDLGEPLMCKMDGSYKLVGLVSWDSVHCEPESPTVYTQISVYKNWISAVTNGKL
ncbi:ovochymase-1 isoform X1 [Erythrolamprus reginae]|uniref:ovochymase-1 isoform X1 n=1 Tax=Erythrolamprus reginae TaxID=121349 RepID=UPI00396C46D5